MALKNIVFGLLVTAFFCFVRGYGYGQHNANEAHEALRAESIAATEQSLRHEFERQLSQANQSVSALRTQKAALAKTISELEKRIAHVSRPDCPITTGFVSVYNRAIGAGVPTTDAAAGADRAPSATQAAHSSGHDTALSDVNQQDILRHVVDYGGQCQAIAAQLNQLIDYLQATTQ